VVAVEEMFSVRSDESDVDFQQMRDKEARMILEL
jgi:hypothetical protein